MSFVTQTLDSALLEQALAPGVEARFNHRLDRVERASILATGPRDTPIS